MTRLNHYFIQFIMSASLLVLSGHINANEPDEYIVELYETYCQACHSLETTGAPVAFDPSKWEKALSGGVEATISRAIKGAGNMPAQGGCMECGYEDFEELVSYMSQAQDE